MKKAKAKAKAKAKENVIEMVELGLNSPSKNISNEKKSDAGKGKRSQAATTVTRSKNTEEKKLTEIEMGVLNRPEEEIKLETPATIIKSEEHIEKKPVTPSETQKKGYSQARIFQPAMRDKKQEVKLRLPESNSDEMESEDEAMIRKFKVIVVSDLDLSREKIDFINQQVYNVFSPRHKWSIGVDFVTKKINYDEHTIIHLDLWSIPADTRFLSMAHSSVKNTNAVLIFCDPDRTSCRDSIVGWTHYLKKYFNYDEIPIFLIGKTSCSHEAYIQLQTMGKEIIERICPTYHGNYKDEVLSDLAKVLIHSSSQQPEEAAKPQREQHQSSSKKEDAQEQPRCRIM